MTAAVDNGFGTAAQALTEALRAACNNPADAVRLLSVLAAYEPAIAASTAPVTAAIGALSTAMGQLFRRAALTSLARACAAYQPSSYDDAVAIRTAVAAIFDVEIVAAADAGQDASYQALRALRAAVTNDLATRGQDLARLTVITTALPQPSLAIAYRLYRDATRSDDLIARVNPVDPGCMPTSFLALSS